MTVPVEEEFKPQDGKPWMVSAGEYYYPSGGMGDFIGWAETLEHAFSMPSQLRFPTIHEGWREAFNTQTGEFVHQQTQGNGPLGVKK